jgi:site-specific recombinase XerD
VAAPAQAMRKRSAELSLARLVICSRSPRNWTGTHVLRHTAATRLHRRGASLKEVADLLGHQSIDTTAIYTKVDLPTLATVALPWPEEQP